MSARKRQRLIGDGSSTSGNAPAVFAERSTADLNAASPAPRLTRACAECKKHKIKCFVQPGQTACRKCVKSGIACVPHNFAQRFIDDDAKWKADATATIERLKDAVEHLLQQNSLAGLASRDESNNSKTNNDSITSKGDIHNSRTQSLLLAAEQHQRQQQEEQQQQQQVQRQQRQHHGDAEPISHAQTLSPLTTNHEDSATGGNFTPEGPSTASVGATSGTEAAAASPDYADDLVPLPMNNLYNLADPQRSQLMRVNAADANGPDFISQGALGLAEAEFLFDHYRAHINPLLWNGMLCAHKTLREARQSSPLLVAVVLTVAALHIPGRDRALHTTYGAFVSLMRGSCLLRCHDLDAIRALCIGAFYLTSLSWALCSRAVRVATELNLHKSSLQLFERGSPLDSHERVRLWYVLYVCDHQFALAYGRPPMMHEDAAIRNADKLLASGLSTPGDRGLVAQVKLFRILASAYFMHGCDPDLELKDHDFERLRAFDVSVEQWRLEQQQQQLQSHLGPLARGGGAGGVDGLSSSAVSGLGMGMVGMGLGMGISQGPSAMAMAMTMAPSHSQASALYYHLARFQLNSVALRGISRAVSPDATTGSVDWDRQEASNAAIVAAMSMARLIADDAGLQHVLIGLPIFAHAMIAVCASFLLKMAVVFAEPDAAGDKVLRLPDGLAQHGLNFHTPTALRHVRRLVGVLDSVADKASRRHVARQVVTGLAELLQLFSPGQDGRWYYSLPRSRAEASGAATATAQAFDSNNNAAQRGDGNGGGVGTREGEAARQETMQDLSGGQAEPLVAGTDMAMPHQQPQQDVFDLTGDLDWRFDDCFLLGIDFADSELEFL